ncbi:CotS family spore coat protein [Clostridium sp. SHJSY1]|uniref:CotS family spore coat protein n=1 Tax=Clostridium sp. SHJSY1 TaxID=2942483 RepID=UPI002874A486|nr:CotS family spore coat protein [Clostridium sp. SHJSY1]MDS0528122.1 CotS family spore coat protein [Clostridium sp. SHJSY1]
MNKLRYPEKKYLSTYELSSSFFRELGIKVIDITPLRKVFILKTEEGNKILKKVNYGIERLEFIDKCIEGIHKNFPNIISFNSFKDGKKYKLWKGSYYIVMDLIPGREATFTNPIELNLCAKTLGSMHIASKKILKDFDLNENIEKSLINKYIESLEDILKIKDLIESYKYRNEFDNLFYGQIDECIDEMKKAIELIKYSGYRLYRENMKNVVVCHNDLAEHNFLYANDEMYLIDFDYCSIDLRIMDVADLILKGIKEAAFDFEKAIDVIKAYDSVYQIDKEEYKYIYILLLFPRDIYSIAKDYYHKQKGWDEEVFVNRLKMKLINEEFRRGFLKKYKEVFKEKFN